MCSSASLIPSCPSELGTPSISLISRSLSSRFALPFYFQSLGTALSPGGSGHPKESLSGEDNLGLTEWLHGPHQPGLPVLSFPLPGGIGTGWEQLLLATTSGFYLGLLGYWKGKQRGNQPVPTRPDANPLGLVSSASSRAQIPTASPFFTKKILSISSTSRTDKRPSQAILNSSVGRGRGSETAPGGP